jgi:hypothetical protein
MPDREAVHAELALLLAAIAKARENDDQVAVELFARDIDAALKLLGW